MALAKNTETVDETLPGASDSNGQPPLARAGSDGAPPLDDYLHQQATSQITLEFSYRGCGSQKRAMAVLSLRDVATKSEILIA